MCGTHGRTGVSKILLGSVAENIYRHAPCPVLTVGPNVAGEPESVGDIRLRSYCATDFSRESLAAVPYAVSLAREKQARLYFLHVTETPVGAAVAEREMAGSLLDLVPTDAGLSCAPKAFVDFGEPAPKITELAEELKVDLDRARTQAVVQIREFKPSARRHGAVRGSARRFAPSYDALRPLPGAGATRVNPTLRGGERRLD